MSGLPDENLKIYFFFFLVIVFAFFELMPIANLDIENTSYKDITKTITASSLRFGQLKEDGE